MMNKSKTKIVIASILKPVDDVRNYEKIATSLAKNDNYEVIVLGSPSSSNQSTGNVLTKSWSPFRRLSLKRLFVQFEYWKELRELKPEIIIFTTFELHFTSVVYKCFYNSQLVYDMQEDYFMNLWYQRFYPTGIRHLLAISIRLMEICLSPFVMKYLLAEKAYFNDVKFVRNKSMVIENKSLPIDREVTSQGFKVIFTGTITSYSRAIESIELFQKIKDEIPESSMKVIGHVPNHGYRKLIEERFGGMPELTLKLSDQPIPHFKILDYIKSAHLAIIGYQPNKVNENKIPTKLYEYTSAKLPYLVQKNTAWSQIGSVFGGAIPVDFLMPDISNIVIALDNISFESDMKSGYLWTEEETKLLRAFS